METEVNHDFREYWNEVRHFHSTDDLNDDCSSPSGDEGEAETEWLQEVGLPELAEPFRLGREIPESELSNILATYTQEETKTIKSRVKKLNNTVRQRKFKKYRKAHVRDVYFGDAENHSSGSRSLTPDSLDSDDLLLEEVDSLPSNNTTTIYVGDNSMYVEDRNKKPLARVPSAPIARHLHNQNKPVLAGSAPQTPPSHAPLFKKYTPDVAGSTSDGVITLLRYQHHGTLPRHRSGSDPSHLDVYEDSQVQLSGSLALPQVMRRLSRSHGNLLDVEPFSGGSRVSSQLEDVDRTWIDRLGDADVDKLRRRFLVKVTAILDSSAKPMRKRKFPRPRPKSESSVFQVPLSVLLEKDGRFIAAEYTPGVKVPVIFQKLIGHLERHYLGEEGLLRLAGLKARTDSLTAAIESHFYTDPGRIDEMLYQSSAHDVSSALKKLLRELPDPLLTLKLLQMFYHVTELPEESRQEALNLLVLLLPGDHQATLRYLLNFATKVAQHKQTNKMDAHSVATILAPSLFPPRFLNLSKDDIASQVSCAEACIKLTEALLAYGETLWLVPGHFIADLRSLNQKQERKENSKPKLFGKTKIKTTSFERELANRDIVVEASQFGLKQFPVQITDNTTASDVILQIMHEGTMLAEKKERAPSERQRRPLELVDDEFNLSCILSSGQADTALQTHFLCEHGGNIVQRELDHSVQILRVLAANPGASWRLQCRHRNCPKR